MEQSVFEQRLKELRETVGEQDPAYQSAGPGASYQALRDYLKKRRWVGIGSSRMDGRLAAISDLYVNSDDQQRKVLVELFSSTQQLEELQTFVARSARLVEHTGDPQWLRRGLAAACLEGGRLDFRDMHLTLLILRYGAERVGITIGKYFDEAREMISPVEGTDIRPSLENVARSSKYWLRSSVRQCGPPEWQDEVKPWWKFW